ncbi:MAG: LuxR C-terminal-related transcriptional regulator [Hyphomicrobiaceae bacterium]
MRNATSTEHVSELISAIYACPGEPERWPAALHAIGRAINADAGSLTLVQCSSARAVFSARSAGEDACHAMADNDDGSLAALATLMRDHPVVESASPRGSTSGGPQHAGVVFLRERGLVGYARWTWGGAGNSGRRNTKALRMLRMISPHLRRAIELDGRIASDSAIAQRLTGLLDQLALAVVLTDSEGTVVHANVPARRMMAGEGPLRLRGARLGLACQDAASRLAHVIRDKAEATCEGHEASCVAISGPNHAARPAVAYVCRIARHMRDSGLLPSAVVAVLVPCPGQSASVSADALGALFELTPKESHVLKAIAQGATLPAVAAQFSIALSTVKTHLTSVMDKIGAARQADIVRIAAELSLPVACAPSAVPALCAPSPVQAKRTA